MFPSWYIATVLAGLSLPWILGFWMIIRLWSPGKHLLFLLGQIMIIMAGLDLLYLNVIHYTNDYIGYIIAFTLLLIIGISMIIRDLISYKIMTR